MNIFLTGGTGFIGRALVKALQAEGHSLTLLTRDETRARALLAAENLRFCTNLNRIADFSEFDAVINLAGEPIFEKRWDYAQKQRLTDSRVNLTEALATRIRQSQTPPAVLISGSATGFYGNLTQISDETAPAAHNFAATLCQAWEAAALSVQDHTRVCLLRTGIVLDPSGGALQKMLPLYRLGLGGKLGCGEQHWAWIALQDQVNAIRFLLHQSHCQGAFNLVAPTLTTQAAFNQQLAAALKRPAFCNVPRVVLKTLLGERATLLLDNQPLLPKNLQQAGFNFEFPRLTELFNSL